MNQSQSPSEQSCRHWGRMKPFQAHIAGFLRFANFFQLDRPLLISTRFWVSTKVGTVYRKWNSLKTFRSVPLLSQVWCFSVSSKQAFVSVPRLPQLSGSFSNDDRGRGHQSLSIPSWLFISRSFTAFQLKYTFKRNATKEKVRVCLPRALTTECRKCSINGNFEGNSCWLWFLRSALTLRI